MSNNIQTPVLFMEKSQCCGCSACFASCPTGAIIMKEDQEGFLYPYIQKEKCVSCYRCLKVCAFKVDLQEKPYDRKQQNPVKNLYEGKKEADTIPLVFAAKHKNLETRMDSRSGGIFSALSDQVLKSNGVVYGCVLTSDFNAKHVRADNYEIRDKMRGSKYIQSDMTSIFKSVKNDLLNKRFVLFSGTSCQIAGLQFYLEKPYTNLLCIDIVCHGVPSPKVWQSYLDWQSKRKKSKCVKVDFRDKKKFGWAEHKETLYFNNRKSISSDIFKNLFYGHEILRPSCYQCPYKNILHPGDITIADYWGIEKAAPGFDDNKGVSLVLVNNEKGLTWFDKTKKDMEYVQCRIEDSMQPPLKAPFREPLDRESFWKDFEVKDFTYIAKKYGGYGIKNMAKKQYRTVKTMIKSLLVK